MYAGVDKYGGAVVGEGQPDGASSNTAPQGLSLEEAVETAAAEETVVVDVPFSYYEDDDDASTLVTGTSQVLLAAQLNPEAGGLMWVEQESTQAAYKNVVAMSQMTSMLRDTDRNGCYERGIAAAIARFTALHKRAPVVLDIGTGTGLLSLFAAKHGAQHVYACEMFAPMAAIAQRVTAAHYCDKITVFALRSTDLVVATDGTPATTETAHLPQRADMLVSELFDSILLGEAVIPIVRHALAHLLVPGAVVLPERATVFAQVVQNDQIYRMNSLAGQSVNDSGARLARSDAALQCTGAKPALPLHVKALEASPSHVVLTQPTPVLSFDFTKPIASPSEMTESYQETVVTAVASGHVHGVVMWWHVSFDADNSVVYSTEPAVQNWQDHWVQVVFPLTDSLDVQPTDALVLRAHHDDLRIWFDVERRASTSSSSSSDSMNDDALVAASAAKKSRMKAVQVEKEPCTCGLHLVSNAERIAMLADEQRTSAFDAAIVAAIEQLTAIRQRESRSESETTSESDSTLPPTLACLDISDGSLCALLAASRGVANVTSIESKDVSARIYSQILDANTSTFAAGSNVDVLCCGCKGLLPEHLSGDQRVDLLVGEPFYYSMQNLPLWQAINFWLRRSALGATLRDDAIVVPAKARVCAQAVQFEHLHKCFGAVGDVAGFDHASFDAFQDVNYYERNFPFPVYMYPFAASSDVITLGAWSYADMAHSVSSASTIELDATRPVPNGVVVWVEYTLDSAGKHVVATGPTAVHSKQLVRFLATTDSSSDNSAATRKLATRFHFDALEGTIDVDFELVA